MRTKPQLRDALGVVEATLTQALEELAAIRAELRNRSPIQRAPKHARPVTPELREEIFRLHRQQPHISYLSIAKYLNVNPGRVSETLAGRREDA